jgi:hypothetical protein
MSGTSPHIKPEIASIARTPSGTLFVPTLAHFGLVSEAAFVKMRNKTRTMSMRSVVEKHELISQFPYFRQLPQSVVVVVGNTAEWREPATVIDANQDTAQVQRRIFGSEIDYFHFVGNRFCPVDELRIKRFSLINEGFTSLQQSLQFLICFRSFEWRCAGLKKLRKGGLQMGFVKGCLS